MTVETDNTLFSEKVMAGSRIYFFDVKESIDGTKYLTITETRAPFSQRERHRVMVFEEHMEAFHEAYEQAFDLFAVKPRSVRVDKIRKQYPNAYKEWTPEDDSQLVGKFEQGTEILELAAIFQRKPSAIRSRLEKLALLAFDPDIEEDTRSL